MSRHTFLSRWWIFEPCSFLGGYQMSFFFIGAWYMIGAFHLEYFTQGHTSFSRWWFFGHSCSLEAIRFISHWSTRYDWVISLMWSQEHSLLIIVDIFLRWLDQDTDTYESLQWSLVISEFALYWGITLLLAFGLKDTSLHRGMIMSERIFVEAYLAWSFSHWDMLFL